MAKTKREIDLEMFERQIRMEETLEKILEQAVKTNGRITTNEQDISHLKGEHKQVKTVFYTVSTLLTIMWTGVTFLFK